MVQYNKEEMKNEGYKTLPDGEYAFSVDAATDEVSKKGNEMIVLNLVVEDARTQNRVRVRDWLAFARKCRNFCRAVGLQRKLEADLCELLSHECVGRVGRLSLTTNENGFNTVEEYVELEPAKAESLDDLPSDTATDDIPF